VACRICLAGEQEDKLLLRACHCDGSMRWVHSACIVEWLHLNRAAPLRCEICGKDFDVVFSEIGRPLGVRYFDFELDNPEFEDSGLLSVFLIAFSWTCFLVCVEAMIYSLDLILPGCAWLWMIVDVSMAIIYDCCIFLKVSILIIGGANWEPEDWGVLFAQTEVFFEAVKVFLADMGFGLKCVPCIVGAASVRSIFAVAMKYPLQRCHTYCGSYAVLLSSTINVAAFAWLLKRAFLDKQPVVSEVKGELLRTGLRCNQD